jgi:hypothetical protein
MTAWLVAILSFVALGMAAVAGYAGYCLALIRIRREIAEANEPVAIQIERWRQNETMAGAYAIPLLGGPASSIEGVDRCYYSPPDFKLVTWVGRDMPTPFVGLAPLPGRLASGFINSMQFRYDREIECPKPQNVARVFITGGSTAYCLGATGNNTTIGGYLEKHVNAALGRGGARCEVVTAAAAAWCSTHERILIENRLIDLQPDIVISFSGHNDAFWAVCGHNIMWLRVFQDDYFLALTNAALVANLAEEFPTSVPGGGTPVNAAQAAERLARNVAFSHHALATVGAEYVFALQPVLEVSRKIRTPREERVAAAVSAHSWFIEMASFYQDFRYSLQALQLPGFHFIDSSTVFDAYDDKVDLFVDTAHFGDRANDIIAQHLCGQIVAIIRRRLTLPATLR